MLAAAVLWLLPLLVNAQERAVSWSEMWNLRFRKTDEALFTGTEHAFCVDIVGVSPDRVQVTVNSLPQNASFVSSKKESVTIKRSSGKSVSGTRITLWMEFSKSGFYQLDPVDVVIDKGFYRIPVGTVEVFENPRLVRPQLSLSFDGVGFMGNSVSLEQGESVVFTVSVRGAEEVKDVLWRLPEASVFKRVESYPLPKGTNPLSKEFIPLAKFQWWPLKVGVCQIPDVFVDVVCFNGLHTRETLPSVQVIVSPKNKQESQSTDDSTAIVFLKSDATPSDKASGKIAPVTANIDVASLVSSKKTAVHLFTAFALAAAVCVALCVALVAARKRMALAALAAGVVFAVCAALTIRTSFTPCAVVTEGQLYPIPEKDAVCDVTLVRGSVVIVERVVGEWALVHCGDDRGWIATGEMHLMK